MNCVYKLELGSFEVLGEVPPKRSLDNILRQGLLSPHRAGAACTQCKTRGGEKNQQEYFFITLFVFTYTLTFLLYT